MTRRRWVWRNGHFIEVGAEAQNNETHAVHQDSMEPLKHPVTGEIVDSKTRWNQINKERRLEVVGNDLLSKQPRSIPDRLTEERIRDAMEKAESIVSDPAKLRAKRNENEALLERNKRLLNGRRG